MNPDPYKITNSHALTNSQVSPTFFEQCDHKSAQIASGPLATSLPHSRWLRSRHSALPTCWRLREESSRRFAQATNVLRSSRIQSDRRRARVECWCKLDHPDRRSDETSRKWRSSWADWADNRMERLILLEIRRSPDTCSRGQWWDNPIRRNSPLWSDQR